MTRVAFGWVITVCLAIFLVWWAVARSTETRRLSAIYALALAACIPWLAYTYSATGRFFSWGNSGSLSLYWMASPYPGDLGDWHQADEVFTNPNLAPHRPFFATLRGLDLPAQNARIERQALDLIASHPGRYAENVAANVSRMWFDAPYSFERQRLAALYFALPGAILLGALALAAVAGVRLRHALPAITPAFAVFAAVAFVLHALLAAYPRMLLPIVPVLIWFIGIVLANHVRLTPVRAGP
jgi:hypothetical protein